MCEHGHTMNIKKRTKKKQCERRESTHRQKRNDTYICHVRKIMYLKVIASSSSSSSLYAHIECCIRAIFLRPLIFLSIHFVPLNRGKQTNGHSSNQPPYTIRRVLKVFDALIRQKGTHLIAKHTFFSVCNAQSS